MSEVKIISNKDVELKMIVAGKVYDLAPYIEEAAGNPVTVKIEVGDDEVKNNA